MADFIEYLSYPSTLYKLLQKSTPWIWKKSQEAFEESKEKLLNSSCLTHYDFKCDVSPEGIGACLTHVYQIKLNNQLYSHPEYRLQLKGVIHSWKGKP